MTSNGSSSTIFRDNAEAFFTIDASRPFLQDLTDGLCEALGDDPVAIAEAVILLPTRRGVRALTEAFRRRANERGIKAVLLPQIKPLGDVDEDELSLFAGDVLDEIGLPPAISSTTRKLTLAKMVAAKDRAFAGHANWVAALSAAGELAKLLDSFYTEEVDFKALATLAPEEYAKHWGQSLKFLEIVTEAWPNYLKANEVMDPSDRRAKLIDAQQRRWQAAPPSNPVIIAGTTGSAPSVARLMKTIAGLDKGAVVLPGLDRALARERGWEKMDEGHPQAGLKALLQHLDVSPLSVNGWPLSGGETSRNRILSLALRPAQATDDWRHMVEAAEQNDPGLNAATKDLALIEAIDEEAEASAIAVAMRETLETPSATAMLVTPDRDLSRRVCAKLQRWNVAVDDSAGVPFHNSPCGTFLRLVADWLLHRSNPVALISMARHPLSAFGQNIASARTITNALDLLLRGLAPAGGNVSDIKIKLSADVKNIGDDKLKKIAVVTPIIDLLVEAEAIWKKSAGGDFTENLSAHLAVAELVASSDDTKGAERLWRGDDGEAGAQLLASLRSAATSIDSLGTDYPSIFTQLISSETVRRRNDAHPRLSILGPLEARLQNADRVILGGLNEGNWPADAITDPFLSRDMRRKINLPSPERRIGLAAHDFAQLAASGNVIITRASRASGKPTKPSRWLLRLQNVLNGAGAFDRINESARYAFLTSTLEKPDRVIPAKKPSFAPPLSARPKSLHVTRIGQLLRDPYSIYARHVLKLIKREALGESFGSRHLGNLFHKVFEEFAKAHPKAMPNDTAKLLVDLFENNAAAHGYDSHQDAFWRPEVNATLAWFADFHQSRLAIGKPAVIEGEGTLTLAIEGEEFTLKAYADRIDITANGQIDVFDYKSKTMPSFKQVKSDFNPQLPLTAMIAEAGGFETLDASTINSFYYLRFLQLDPTKTDKTGAEESEAIDAVRAAHEGLRKIIAHYNDEKTPYLSQPRPEFTNDFGDYDQLARRRESLIEVDAS